MVAYNGGNPNYRNVPDVAAVGNPDTGVEVYYKSNGGWSQYGGTSVSAPIWAGYLSIINSGGEYLTGASPFVGFSNPSLYHTATNFYGTEYNFPAGFLQLVLEGDNGDYKLDGTTGYEAGPYYNDCTGLGSLFGPYAFQLIINLENTLPPGAPGVPTAIKATKDSAKISWTAGSGATGYPVVVILLDFSGYGQTIITKKTSLNLTGLFSGLTYRVVVASVSSGGATQSTPNVFSTLK